MSRLKHKDYCEIRSFLSQAWDENDSLFGLVCGGEQWDVHRFFAPTMNFTDERLRAHRIKVSKHDPSLPSRASKLARKMQRFDHVAANHLPAKHTYRRALRAQSSQAGTSVRAVMLPEPDYKKLAKVFITMTGNRQRVEMEQAQHERATEHERTAT